MIWYICITRQILTIFIHIVFTNYVVILFCWWFPTCLVRGLVQYTSWRNNSFQNSLFIKIVSCVVEFTPPPPPPLHWLDEPEPHTRHQLLELLLVSLAWLPLSVTQVCMLAYHFEFICPYLREREYLKSTYRCNTHSAGLASVNTPVLIKWPVNYQWVLSTGWCWQYHVSENM